MTRPSQIVGVIPVDGEPLQTTPATGATFPEGTLTPLGYEQLTAFSAAKALQAVPATATMALIQAESQDVRWRDDGTNPTASVGMVIAAGRDVWYVAGNAGLDALRFIEVTATAKLNVVYYAA